MGYTHAVYYGSFLARTELNWQTNNGTINQLIGRKNTKSQPEMMVDGPPFSYKTTNQYKSLFQAVQLDQDFVVHREGLHKAGTFGALTFLERQQRYKCSSWVADALRAAASHKAQNQVMASGPTDWNLKAVQTP